MTTRTLIGLGLALVVLVPLVWGFLRRSEGLSFFGSPTVRDLEERPEDLPRRLDDLRGLPMGYFGASTGAAAALIAATERPALVHAVVSRGGRPDLAEGALARVQAPTLLIVGGDDEPVIELNREAMAHMRAPVELAIVPGATHLFEEPGALDARDRHEPQPLGVPHSGSIAGVTARLVKYDQHTGDGCGA